MTYQEIRELCRNGKIGKIPNWIGYLKWDYANDQLIFVNGDYVIPENKLQIKDYTNLYYII